MGAGRYCVHKVKRKENEKKKMLTPHTTYTRVPAKTLASMGEQFSEAWILDFEGGPAVLRKYRDGRFDLYLLGVGCSDKKDRPSDLLIGKAW